MAPLSIDFTITCWKLFCDCCYFLVIAPFHSISGKYFMQCQSVYLLLSGNRLQCSLVNSPLISSKNSGTLLWLFSFQLGMRWSSYSLHQLSNWLFCLKSESLMGVATGMADLDLTKSRAWETGSPLIENNILSPFSL